MYDDAPAGVGSAQQLQGKELSYNNINDTNAAYQLVGEFDEPAVVIVKHANPCGVAIAPAIPEAYEKALACDPQSAFGGIIAMNRELDAEFVRALGTLFCEVIIAPSVTPDAAEALSSKKNLRLLITGFSRSAPHKPLQLRSVAGGILAQEADAKMIAREAAKCVTKRMPREAEWADLLFAMRVCKHVKSNAIVFARNGATIGIGAGQMSRVDSVRLAGWKAKEAGLSTEGAVLASDAFFPFDDNVHRAAEHGICAIIQPGGSVRDAEVIAAADGHDMAMIFTGLRHFQH